MGKSRILVADDEKEIQLLLKKYLQREGYEVDTASDGKDVLEKFNNNKYHLIILDLMMPEIDGIETCRLLRNKTNIPIIMLTAKDSEVDKVIGLSIGADDYITKPFSINELIARVKAHLRRYFILSNQDSKISKELSFGNLIIDLKSYRVFKNNKEIQLTAKEFELLKFLASNHEQVFTKRQIFRQVWKNEYLEDDNTVMVHIRRLRKKIEDNPKKPQYIQTVWGIGYKFTGVEKE
ncbi:response regulator transcription factor [Thermohalobacter berrensis]|uniref:DNA-binding response regulator n=1 Tax=Thermohalobacter berrensis TaxID=99594 RepID=A0A419SV12_9FIRM|nr:response regulator transcription factor [Thermohalobacter berrensis]RKD29068.1 DNA-binding response regulator [Thermohalobacter berrensis]